MKRIFLLVILIAFGAMTSIAQPIQLRVLSDAGFRPDDHFAVVSDGGNAFLFGKPYKDLSRKDTLYRINLVSGDVTPIAKMYLALATIGNRFVEMREKGDGYELFYLDPTLNSAQPMPADLQEHIKSIRGTFLYYQNDFMFTSQWAGRESVAPFMFNLSTGTKERLVVPDGLGRPLSISDDKGHLLILNNGNGIHVDIWDTARKKVAAQVPFGGTGWPRGRLAYFLTNGLFFTPPPDMNSTEPYFYLWDVTGKERDRIEFTLTGANTEGSTVYAVWFLPGLTRAIVDYGSTMEHEVVVDSTAFRNHLDKLGLLFHPTTGVLNDSQVNFRQNPNLQAKVIGSLNKGDKVQVLDRSGTKQKIGSYDSYWYQVKRADGTEGWAYGAFIDLAKSTR